jgi:hypothetical protein
MSATELALSIVEARRLPELETIESLDVERIAAILGDDSAAAFCPQAAVVSHLYFGSEFCEHLFPEPAALERAVAVTKQLGMTLTLATPIANDLLVSRILEAAAQLPPAAEILVNDWGVASAVRAAQPHRALIAGRQLAKMIKDPRVASPAWMKPYPSGYDAPGYRSVLARLGIGRIELDVPPFASPETFAVPDLAVSVWAPFAYIAKGRICKIGSMRQREQDKFRPGGMCHRECLGVLEVSATPSAAGLVSYSRGNSIYYRHDSGMGQALRAAIGKGAVSRLVLSGV